jgi:tRNA A37 methylthiotransferase MiaB
MANIEHIPLTHLHAFTYSKRSGTPSASMKSEVSGTISKKRLHELQSYIDANNLLFRQKNSQVLEVLIESAKDGLYQGFDQFYNKIIIKSDADISGEWKSIEKYTVLEGYNYVQL